MDKVEGAKADSVWNSVLVHFIHHLACTSAQMVYFLSTYSPFQEPWQINERVGVQRQQQDNGLQKSAKWLLDVTSNKKNSLKQAITTEWPKPRPLKKNAELQHTKRNGSIEGEFDDDEGAAMAAERWGTMYYLSKKGNHFWLRTALWVNLSQRIFQQPEVVRGCHGNEVDVNDDVYADFDNANLSDEVMLSLTKAVSNHIFLQILRAPWSIGMVTIQCTIWGLRFHSKVQLELETYPVSHHTPCSLSFSRLMPSGWRHASHC